LLWPGRLAVVCPCTVPCPLPEPVRVSIRAAGRLNPSESGEALATTVRLYQLKDVSKLQAASLEQILDNDRAVLGDDLVSVKEITLYPMRGHPGNGPTRGARFFAVSRFFAIPPGHNGGGEQAGPARCPVLPRARRRGRALGPALQAGGQPRGIALTEESEP